MDAKLCFAKKYPHDRIYIGTNSGSIGTETDEVLTATLLKMGEGLAV